MKKKFIFISAVAMILVAGVSAIAIFASPSSATEAPEINAINSSGDSSDTVSVNDIGLEAAKKSALDHAKLTESQVTFTKSKLDKEDGKLIYDIEFVANDMEYEFEISASDGSVREYSMEAVNKVSSSSNSSATGSENYIGLEPAKKIALDYTNLIQNQVTFTKEKLDQEDGITVYEIEFVVNGIEYEFEINAITGNIVDFESDTDDD